MKRTTIILALLILMTSAIFGSVGKIESLKGTVFIVRGSGTLNATAGQALEKKDVIITESDGWARVKLSDGTSITLGKNSKLVIEKYLYDGTKKSHTTLGFAKGVFKTITGAIGKVAPEKFKVKTPNATIGIRGTEFFVEIAKGKVHIICTVGIISVGNSYGVVIVNAGSQTFAAPGVKPTLPTKADIKILKIFKKRVEPETQGNTNGGEGTEGNGAGINKGSNERGRGTPPNIGGRESGNGNEILTDEEKKILEKSLSGLVNKVASQRGISPESEEFERYINNALNTDKTRDNTDEAAEGEQPEKPDMPPIGPPPGEKETVYSDDYLSYGYWVKEEQPTGTWVTGHLTDDRVLEEMVDRGQQAHYSGGIAAINNGTKVPGKIDLDVDFGASRFSGNMDIGGENGARWNANIENGRLRGNGLFSDTITPSATSDITDISGSMKGNFFGPKAEAVGGNFDLHSDRAGDMTGSFGANR